MMPNIVVLLIYVVLLAGYIGVAYVACAIVPKTVNYVLDGDSRRKHALDGLRGILALSVFIHHTMLPYFLGRIIDDKTASENRFILQMGAVPVALFFMISAYLFGGKLIKHEGKIDILRFFYGRIMRIFPLYLLAVGVTVFLAFAMQNFSLVEPLQKVAKEIGRHLLFDFINRYGINGFEEAHDVLPQVWSLRFEWILYFTIPIMAGLYRFFRHPIILYAPLFLGGLLFSSYFYFFVAGLASTQLASNINSSRMRLLWQLLAVPCLLTVFSLFDRSSGLLVALLLIPPFVAVVQEHRWVSLLGIRPIRFLGEISYSIYLLHGIVMFIFFQSTGLKWANFNRVNFILVDLALGTLIIIVCTFTFIFVEKPLMYAGIKRDRTGR